jgi:AraC-like DNA-binding protein
MDTALTTEGYHLEYRESRAARRLSWESHCHARYEMIAVLEGDVEIAPEGHRYRLTAGQTLIVPPLCYHTVTSRAEDGIYRRVTALFSEEAVPTVLREAFRARTALFPVFPLPTASRLADLCRAEEKAFLAPLAEGLMTEALYACLLSEVHPERGTVDTRLQDALAYVDAHPFEKITIGQLARALACSPSTVSHLFSERLGTSPKQYVLEKRMALAEREIALGTPPTLVAARLGYANYSSFYRLYRKRFQRSPREKE